MSCFHVVYFLVFPLSEYSEIKNILPSASHLLKGITDAKLIPVHLKGYQKTPDIFGLVSNMTVQQHPNAKPSKAHIAILILLTSNESLPSNQSNIDACCYRPHWY